MRLEHYPVEKFKREVLKVLQSHLNLKGYRVFFFGSRVAGKGTDRADIDIGIEGPEPVPSEALINIQEEIENFPVLYKIELVDFRRVTPKFRAVALERVEMFYPES